MKGRSAGLRKPLLTAPLRQFSRSYPLEDWDCLTKATVVAALRAAWERMVSQVGLDGGLLAAETENQLTARLQAALSQIQGEPDHPSGFSGAIFQDVTRNEDVTSYDFHSLEKSPDLIFRLISTTPGIDRHLRALHVECKIVGPSHPVRLYCTHGIRRFICGDYAWAMLSGMMIGFSHGGFTVPEKLSPLLESPNPQAGEYRAKTLPFLKPKIQGVPPLFESVHERTWTYPHDGTSPGDIAILHLWLPLPSPGARLEEE